MSRRIRVLRGGTSDFEKFQDTVRGSTWKKHDAVLDWALARSKSPGDSGNGQSSNPLVARGWELRTAVETAFCNKYKGTLDSLRVMIQLPDFAASPGGYSLFSNLISALQYVGVPAAPLKWTDSVAEAFRSFRPTCFMTSDASSSLDRIDWGFVRAWKRKDRLLLGLTASLQEYGNTPLAGRLSWAAKNGIDFYYTFGSPEYVRTREAYRPFFDMGYPVLHLEFGANPALYFPVDQEQKDLDYVFLASSNPDKQARYSQYLPRIVHRHHGFIDGPGWNRLSRYAPAETHRFLYSRARVGLNLHIPASVQWPNELNERTYILAACGVPQVIDSPLLLPQRFSGECFFAADTPEEYNEAFRTALNDPAEARRRASRALEEVYARHTSYHRVDAFLKELTVQLPTQ